MTGTRTPTLPTGTLAGRVVARIGYGAMQLALTGARAKAEPARSIEVLRRAVRLGVNHIDTASFYGDALSNELIHTALHPYPDDLVLVSKVGAAFVGERRLVPAQRPEDLRAGVEIDLRSLGIEQVPVVNLRLLGGRVGLRPEGDQVVDLDSQLGEMIALRDEGKIGAIGLSGAADEQLRAALPAGIACVQNYYNLVSREDEQLLQTCRDHDIAWVPFFPLGQAYGDRWRVADHPVVIEVADAIGATPSQVALAWLLGHAPNILLIPGTASLRHLAENVAAGGYRLDREATAALDGIADGAVGEPGELS
jgi:aryl-alcohol dehydrogenase-like predicted oxidoreductase